MKYALIATCAKEVVGEPYKQYPTQLQGVLAQITKPDRFNLRTVIEEKPVDKFNDYDIIIVINYAIYDINFIDWLKSHTKAKIVLLTSVVIDRLITEAMHEKNTHAESYFKWFSMADGMFVWCEDEVRYYKLFMGEKPVVSLNMPQAVEVTYMKPKRNGRIILNNILSNSFRNSFTGAMVAGYLKRDVDIHIRSKLHNREQSYIDYIQNKFGIKVSYLDKIPIVRYPEFVKVASEYSLALNMEPATISGRFTGDMALAGVPCVGSNTLNQQRDLYPTLSCGAFDGMTAIDLCKTALDDTDFAITKEAQRQKVIQSSRELVKSRIESMEKEIMK